MFVQFFYAVRQAGVPASPGEFLDLLRILQATTDQGERPDMMTLFRLGRLTLVKDIKHYDAYERAFATTFGHLINDQDFQKQLQEWLEKAREFELSQERKKNAALVPSEQLLDELRKRLEEQKERHDGGNKWVGTGGTSPFGHSGFNPQGLRAGGSGGGKSALAVLGERRFANYRTDETLNLRSLKIALKKLRDLKQLGPMKLSITKSVERSAREGDIELVHSQSRKNQMKLILLLDVGGSMTPFARQVNQLFSAAHQLQHFKAFKCYYFHNIMYDLVYPDAYLMRSKGISLDRLAREFDHRTRVIIVGDASMAPYELLEMNEGLRLAYDTWQRTGIDMSSPTGLERLQKMRRRWPKSIWLNPMKEDWWEGPTVRLVRKEIPMFRLTVDGLNQAVKSLLST